MTNPETERLLLCVNTLEDRANFIGLLTDESVMRFVDTGVYTIGKAEELWRKLIDEFHPQGIDTIYGVFMKENLQYIGQCWIRPSPLKKEDWEIGYVLKTNAWGRGFATEIARKLVEFGFSELDLPEVFATIDNDNAASIKVAEKAGMNFLRCESDEEGIFSVYSIKKHRKTL